MNHIPNNNNNVKIRSTKGKLSSQLGWVMNEATGGDGCFFSKDSVFLDL